MITNLKTDLRNSFSLTTTTRTVNMTEHDLNSSVSVNEYLSVKVVNNPYHRDNIRGNRPRQLFK